ncbi:hypothetical protein T484DRAFT_3044564 [Baffinella frigidus]|nr:hypothetical protein T484DRAFT_3044564 [Cryptophyta sp. CCMP2293]
MGALLTPRGGDESAAQAKLCASIANTNCSNQNLHKQCSTLWRNKPSSARNIRACAPPPSLPPSPLSPTTLLSTPLVERRAELSSLLSLSLSRGILQAPVLSPRPVGLEREREPHPPIPYRQQQGPPVAGARLWSLPQPRRATSSPSRRPPFHRLSSPLLSRPASSPVPTAGTLPPPPAPAPSTHLGRSWRCERRARPTQEVAPPLSLPPPRFDRCSSPLLLQWYGRCTTEETETICA